MKRGIYILAVPIWILKLWFPKWYGPSAIIAGIVTGIAMFYLMHYLVFTACSRPVRRLCFPLLGTIDLMAVAGVASFFIKFE
jgi:putative flippase GtrA